MNAAVAIARPRRTQEQRSASTQRLLLDAAVDCLVEHGYSALTTTMVAERAGVSRGAQLHHYPSRASLVAAAVEHVFSGLTEQYRAGFAALDQEQRTTAAAVALLWAMYREQRHQAVLDLYSAARTDAELRAVLLPIAARHGQNVRALAVEYFPEAARDPRFAVTLDLLLQAMLGMALARCLYGDDGLSPDLLPALETIATEVVGVAPSAGSKTLRVATTARRSTHQGPSRSNRS